MTKEIESLQKLDKTYTGVMFLGATTPSFDKETEIDATFPVEHIQDNDIKSVCSMFTGNFMQLPPAFSAIKIKGKRAYIYARKNQKIELQPREVTISEFDICAKEFPKLSFHVKCSKGTYIRSLTRDVGIALNSGAYLESLCRNAIGNFNLSDAFQLNEIEEMLKK
jgi:tRNA pseudouridine55 synthase